MPASRLETSLRLIEISLVLIETLELKFSSEASVRQSFSKIDKICRFFAASFGGLPKEKLRLDSPRQVGWYLRTLSKIMEFSSVASSLSSKESSKSAKRL